MKNMNNKLEKLNLENVKLKDGRATKERNDLIEKQKKTIEKQKNIIIEKNGIIEALGHKLVINFREDDEINYDDFEISM